MARSVFEWHVIGHASLCCLYVKTAVECVIDAAVGQLIELMRPARGDPLALGLLAGTGKRATRGWLFIGVIDYTTTE